MDDAFDTLRKLETLIADRKKADPDTSYVARLYAKGSRKIAQKVGEEAVETAMAVSADDNRELVQESADLLFHLMILLQSRGLTLADVCEELDRREGISGITEKANRGK